MLTISFKKVILIFIRKYINTFNKKVIFLHFFGNIFLARVKLFKILMRYVFLLYKFPI